MREFLTAAVLAVLLLGYSAQANAQFATSDDEATTQRAERILENLKYQISELRELNVTMGEITSSDIDGLDEGGFTVNGQQSYSFFVTPDDTRLFLLSANPLDVSMSLVDIAAAMEEERLAAALQEEERHQELMAFAADMPARGNPDAPVTIFEFSDFQCPYCARVVTTVEQILANHPDDVKFVFLHYPLPNHPWAKPAAIASICAAEQDESAFWTLHDHYFSNQQGLNTGNLLARSREFLAAGGSNIDLDAWSSCAENTASEGYLQASTAIDNAVASGTAYGVSGTPGFFINGRFVNGAQPLETFEEVIEEVLQDADR